MLRFYLSLRPRTNTGFSDLKLDDQEVKVTREMMELLRRYLEERKIRLHGAILILRSAEEAKNFCDSNLFNIKIVKTQSKDHHQSAAALVATVGGIAFRVCQKLSEGANICPARRCVWQFGGQLHVSARNLDGAIPSLRNPYVVWEIKEYWGKTKGGSKMSDAVYECNLVGGEIRKFEETVGYKISHIVFLDGKEQWGYRRSDLGRFIDLEYQGLIDYLFVGREIETGWERLLEELIRKAWA